MRKRKNRKGGFLMFMGLLLIAAALLLTVRNIVEQRSAEIAANAVVDVLHAEIPSYNGASAPAEPIISVSGDVVDVPASSADDEWPTDNTGAAVPAVQALDGSWQPWPVNESGEMATEPRDAAGAVIQWPVDAVGTPIAWPVDDAGMPAKRIVDAKGNVYIWPENAAGLDPQAAEGRGNIVMLPADGEGKIAFDASRAAGTAAWPVDDAGNILPWLSGGENVVPWPTDNHGRAISAAKAAMHRRETMKARILEAMPDYERYPDMEMPVTKIKGEYYIGVLDIPGQRISLPVMTDWSYSKLKVSPCRYSGSVYSGDIVISGHNYWRHFSKIKRMTAGEALVFTDVDGNVFNYEVSEIQILKPTAVEEMKSGDWDLTLFTCTSGGSSRFAVRCTLVNSVPARG